MITARGLTGRQSLLVALMAMVCLALLPSCQKKDERLEPRSLTWAELRAVRSPVWVTQPGEGERRTYPQERLADGAHVRIEAGGLAWLRRDGGATFLVRGPARLTLRARALAVDEGRVFVDTPPGSVSELSTAAGKLTLAAVRASLTVPPQGPPQAYVLSGEVRAEKGRARAGEELTLESGGAMKVAPVLGWDDWTGGLATTDRAAAPAPFGVGTVGARAPEEQGAPRFPLSIQRMDVRVSIDGDFALTEVDQSFFNPSSEIVEGLYGFRTPERAILQRFGVDRDGVVVWGRVKEKAAAAAQYQSNVYQGSSEDPALLEWEAPGVYHARLYPIGPGETRRVVVRYAEWLERSGESAQRRVYTYPMAAEGSEDSLPHVEELKVTFDLSRAAAREARVGMAGVKSGESLVVRAHDFVPRADLALELLDEGVREQRAYRARHVVDLEALAPEERAPASNKAQDEADYLLVPVRPSDVKLPSGGLDLAIVIDASAATDAPTLSMARAATAALLSHLSEQDRAVVLAGDDGLRPIVAGWDKLAKVDDRARLQVQDALSSVARGGATDLGAMLADASRQLDPARRSAVVYIGDGAPTVGELTLSSLRERLGKLPAPVRVFALGVGDGARMDILAGLARGAFAERITDGHGAARAALRVLEETERPAWLGTKIDLGPSVERAYPSQASALISGETLWVVGRLSSRQEPERLKTTGPSGQSESKLHVVPFQDSGDIGRRWAAARLAQMLEDGEGRAALVDLGMKNGIITPVTSFYVPTKNEMSPSERAELDSRSASIKRRALSEGALQADDKRADAEARPQSSTENKEGGVGTRAKGEEGSMGGPSLKPGNAGGGLVQDAPAAASAAAAPLELAPEPAAAAAPAEEAAGDRKRLAGAALSAIGSVSNEDAKSAAPRAAATATSDVAPAKPSASRSTSPDDTGAQRQALRAVSKSDEVPLGALEFATGSPVAAQGFGAGHGRLGGAHAASAPKVRMAATTVSGRLPPEIIQRIVRQNFGRFRVCYEAGLRQNPSLQGRVSVGFVIGVDGGVSRVRSGGSDLPDPSVVSCVVSAFNELSFPQPEGGVVSVVFPLDFMPGDVPPAVTPAPSPRRPINVNVFLGDLPRQLLGCSAAASAPLEERVRLWRERLSKIAGDTQALLIMYRAALGACEAPSYRERARLLTLLLEAMPGITAKVGLYRQMTHDWGAADVLYRGILARIRTPEEMRELHTALGLQTVDQAILAKLIESTPNAAERAKKLRALLEQFPDDLGLSLELLNAYEDAGDGGAARDHARRLRERPDADARVRTAVGELYLRLAARADSAADKASLQAEGRRAFGEIVEFAPEDPVARRRLGDLLLSHGFFAEAGRQYETLARLTPDDTKVALLLASAAEGQGLLEEALKWAEKGGASGAPDGSSGPAATARALAATHLAWARLAATEGKRAEELSALTARASRVLSAGRLEPDKPLGIRVSLTWSHPELHPSLWSNALGTALPAADGDVTLGIAQAIVPERGDAYVEVRLEPSDLAHAARLGASAELTVVFDELGKTEKIVRKRVTFQRGAPAAQRFQLTGKEVQGG